MTQTAPHSLGYTSAPSPPARSGRFHYSATHFLAILVLFLVVSPLIDQPPFGTAAEGVIMTLVLLAGVLAVGGRPWKLLLGALLAAPAILAKSLHLLTPSNITGFLYPICGVAFVTFVGVELLRHVIRASSVHTDTVCAAISAYLLIGLAWMFVYLFVERLLPGSFGGTSNSDGRLDPFEAFYLSFGTLTTAGTGDIAAVARIARALTVCEALAGVLVLATLIARLVSAYSAPRASDSR